MPDIPALPKRADDVHKGDVGRILIIGGRLDEVGMVGAPALCANAAFRAGAGLVQILTPPEVQRAVAPLAPCATTRALSMDGTGSLTAAAVEFGADVVAVGPGLSPAVTDAQVLDLLAGFSGGVVIDADALNALSRLGKWKGNWPHQLVLTPHPGEMRRLLSGRGLDVPVERRRDAAVALAKDTGAVVVLKGAGTVVAGGARVYINQTGNAGMATGGAGDVLTGIIAALMGQTMTPYAAAVLGVYLHGLAGDMAAEEVGRLSLTALDLIDFLPEAIIDHDPGQPD